MGAFGKVKVAKHQLSGVNVAIKIINKKKIKNTKMNAKIKREINLMQYLRHPNLIQLYEVFHTQNEILVVMEFAQKGELFNLI